MRGLITLALLISLTPSVALAYVGPGLGLGALAVIGGLILSVLVAVFALVWYPLKRARARMRARAQGADDDG